MNYDPKEIIERLKLEITLIERGGYFPSVREPRKQLRIFRDSVSCPNIDLEQKAFPCAHCWLEQFVPTIYMDKEEPCHYIPLNARGDTVARLCEAGNEEGAQRELLAWLRRAVERLEKEISAPAAT